MLLQTMEILHECRDIYKINYKYTMELGDMPNDLILVVREYVRPEELYCCNSTYSRGYLSRNRQLLIHRTAYIRFLLRKDMHYIFGILMRNCWDILMRPGTYAYERRKYRSFVEFMEQYCITNQAQRCRQIIRDVK
jgi:hypothetical protein